MTAPPAQPIGVVMLLLAPTGKVIASADDFQTDCHEAHDHLQAAQEARAYGALCTRVIETLAQPALAKAIEVGSYRHIVDTMVRRDKCQLYIHHVGQKPIPDIQF
jgi:hypothetical protein